MTPPPTAPPREPRPLAGLGVVLLHGVRTSGTMWRRQVAVLRSQGAQVVAVDLPGHGRAASQAFSLDAADRCIEAAVAPMRDRGLRVAVVGLSLGGYLALHWGARTPRAPEILVVSSCTAHTGVLRIAHSWRSLACSGRRAGVD